VGLVFDPEYPDYHWYRQNPNLTWSGKSGGGPVSSKDASGITITNPSTADRSYVGAGLFYTEVVGYYCVGGIVDYE